MTDVVTRWTVTRAVRASDLPAPSRLIMLTLADVADTGTAEIPARFTPSLNDIARETGLDKSTVVRHLSALDAAGWVVRTKPDYAAQMRGEPTRYRLTVPADCMTRLVEVVAEGDRGSGTERQGVGAENDRGRRTERHKSQISSDQETDLKNSSSDAAHRPDVEKVCEHLADRMVDNGCTRPEIGQRWRDAARLLIDKDGRTVDQILKAIDWCQDDDFWRSNILSMPKLRAKYDQLRLAAQRSARASPQRQFVERNGMKLKPETAARLDDNARFAAMDAARAAGQQHAIGAS